MKNKIWVKTLNIILALAMLLGNACLPAGRRPLAWALKLNEAANNPVTRGKLEIDTAKLALEQRNEEGKSNFPKDILGEDRRLFKLARQLRMPIYSKLDNATYVWDADGVEAALEAEYAKGSNDEKMSSIITVDENGRPVGRLAEGGALLDTNFRNDRRKQLARAIYEPGFNAFDVPPEAKKIDFYGMSQFIPAMPSERVVLPPLSVKNSLAEVLHNEGIVLAYVFDGEKGKFVPTLRGGRPDPYPTEDMEFALISMPVLITKVQVDEFKPAVSQRLRPDKDEYIAWFYGEVPRQLEGQKIPNNQQWRYPGLSAFRVVEANVKKVETAKPGTVVATNISLADLIGHVAIKNLEKIEELFIERADGTFEIKSGNGWDSVLAALKIVDEGIGEIAKAVEKREGVYILVGDHGSVDDMTQPNHSFNRVPVFIVDFKNRDVKLVKAKGSLKDTQADVAVTVLHILGIEKPAAEMTGKSLLPKTYTGSRDRIIDWIILDGFGHTDFNNPQNAFGKAMNDGLIPVIKGLYGENNFVVLEAAGQYAGLRGGRQQDFAAQDLMTREQMLERVQGGEAANNPIKITYYDYKDILQASTTYNYKDGIFELTHSPFLNDKDFVVKVHGDGILEVFCLDQSQMGSTEYNTWSLGAGRIVEQSIVILDKLFISGKINDNQASKDFAAEAKSKGYANLSATMQEAGVHASLRQLYYQIQYLKAEGIEKFIFDLASDGRDEGAQDGLGRLRQLRAALEYFGIPESNYTINIRGREMFYDRDNNWPITQAALNELLWGSRIYQPPRTMFDGGSGDLGEAINKYNSMILSNALTEEIKKVITKDQSHSYGYNIDNIFIIIEQGKAQLFKTNRQILSSNIPLQPQTLFDIGKPYDLPEDLAQRYAALFREYGATKVAIRVDPFEFDILPKYFDQIPFVFNHPEIARYYRGKDVSYSYLPAALASESLIIDVNSRTSFFPENIFNNFDFGESRMSIEEFLKDKGIKDPVSSVAVTINDKSIDPSQYSSEPVDIDRVGRVLKYTFKMPPAVERQDNQPPISPEEFQAKRILLRDQVFAAGHTVPVLVEHFAGQLWRYAGYEKWRDGPDSRQQYIYISSDYIFDSIDGLEAFEEFTKELPMFKFKIFVADDNEKALLLGMGIEEDALITRENFVGNNLFYTRNFVLATEEFVKENSWVTYGNGRHIAFERGVPAVLAIPVVVESFMQWDLGLRDFNSPLLMHGVALQPLIDAKILENDNYHIEVSADNRKISVSGLKFTDDYSAKVQEYSQLAQRL